MELFSHLLLPFLLATCAYRNAEMKEILDDSQREKLDLQIRMKELEESLQEVTNEKEETFDKLRVSSKG